MFFLRCRITFIIVFSVTWITQAQVKLPALISDGIVLQRNEKIKLWGWASQGEKVTVSFRDKDYSARTEKDGKWRIVLPAAEAGGPYKMRIRGKNELTIKDILIGDVWICSGQSNMELKMSSPRVRDSYPAEIASSSNSQIRQFLVNRDWSFAPKDDVESGGWKEANPVNIMQFSAVAYFFAKELFQKYKVPIGLINTSYGGTPAESWTSLEGLRDFPAYALEASYFKDPTRVTELLNKDQALTDLWMRTVQSSDIGAPHKNNWAKMKGDSASWKMIQVPGFWENQSLQNVDGIVWYKRKINIPEEMLGKDAVLYLGNIEEQDSTWINGILVGCTNNRYAAREYKVPASTLKRGENEITVKILDTESYGGFVEAKPYKLVAGKHTLPLDGEWYYQIGGRALVPLSSKNITRFINKPTVLFNEMVAPLTGFTVKGVIWYQGENNVGRDVEYKKLLPALITDWRNKWNQSEMPFLVVQLANYLPASEMPGLSTWASLREAQSSATSLKNVGLAVIHDLGEAGDIHPPNKKDVGVRLALAARRIAYKEDITYSGPSYSSMKIEGNKIVLSFTNIGQGLIAKNSDMLNHFAIAGPDKKFRWADAKIEGDKVIVWNDSVEQPVAVRYAWANNPSGANLYNREGLPGPSFRTDSW